MFKGSVASDDLGEVVRALKSAAEPTRLRLLVLLSHGELTVGELCHVLGQSQPRISRHLRVLSEAGLLDRFREQQCVYYRAPARGRLLEWLRQLLSMTHPDTVLLKRDRERALEVVRQRAAAAEQQLSENQAQSSASWREEPASRTVPSGLAAREELSTVLLEELGPSSIGEMLDIGTGSGLMMQILAPRAQHAIGIDIYTPALRLARARVHGAGLSQCEFRRGDMYALAWEEGSFDTVTIDRVLATAERPIAAIAEAARVLRPSGHLILIEDFEQLAARAIDNPLAQLRRWLAGAGFAAARLRPCDLAARHVVVALAQFAVASDPVGDALLRPEPVRVAPQRSERA
jgi:DNA-binding transcriptional ArsR family regulator/SAM-dependent methyltransferase